MKGSQDLSPTFLPKKEKVLPERSFVICTLKEEYWNAKAGSLLCF
jgi:hypothetical protein